MQVKILRLLQEMSFERLGSNHTIQVDVRVLCATNRDLEKAMAQGAFREDLYHRLNVVTIAVPPLRERREDIPSLVEYFLDRYSGELGITKPPLADEALELLKNYAWPGNVRELEHLLQRVLIFTRGYTIQAADLPATLRTTTEPSGSEAGGTDDQPWLNLIRQYFRSYGGTRPRASAGESRTPAARGSLAACQRKPDPRRPAAGTAASHLPCQAAAIRAAGHRRRTLTAFVGRILNPSGGVISGSRRLSFCRSLATLHRSPHPHDGRGPASVF